MNNLKNKSLSLVGTGIKSISHLTTETKTHVRQSDFVLYLVNEPIMGLWIEKNSKNSESLEELYFSNNERSVSYDLIVNKILDYLNIYDHICVAIYGHPTVFAYPGLKAVKEAKNLGINTYIIPAISVEDCLFADLGIDPCTNGCYSVEATDFVLYDRVFDPHSGLIIWQIGVIGDFLTTQKKSSRVALKFLQEKLLDNYPNSHQLYVYEAGIYPTSTPTIIKINIDKITSQEYSTVCTLYVPPLNSEKINKKFFDAIST